MVCDGYVKYEREKFLDQLSCKIIEKKNWNGRLAAISDFANAKFVMGYHYERPSILFYIHGPANLHFFESLKYQKNTQINGLNGHFLIFAPKGESGHWLT